MPKDVYRCCASIMVFRPKGEGFEVLLVHKPRKNDAWQLPQGGCESGESVEEAALREVQEEAGLSPNVLDCSHHVYQYDFPASYRRFRPDNVCGQRVEYVFATADADAVVTVDNEEIDDYAWVEPKQFAKYIHRKQYLRLVHKLFDDGVQCVQSS